MEQKFEKTAREKFGDFYAKPGKRALFSLGCILLGSVIELILPGVGIGMLIAVISVYNLLSFCEKEKIRYLHTVWVTLPNGKQTTCAFFEQKLYACAPFILAFFSLGFYIPHKTQYIMVPHKEIKNIAPNTRVSPVFFQRGFLPVETMPKSKHQAIIANPQIIATELYEQMLPRREAFLQDAKPFLETGLLKEIYHTEDLSVCNFYDDETFVISYYGKCAGAQCVLPFNGEYAERIKEDPGFLFEAYIGASDPDSILLTGEVLERLLRVRNSDAGTEEKESADHLEKKAAAEVEKRYLDELNKKKKVFTHELIVAKLKPGKCTWRMVWAIVMLYFSLAGLALTIGGIGTGMILMTVIALPSWILLTHYGVKNVKISRKNRELLMARQYKIQKVICTDRIAEQITDADGNPCGYEYIHRFSNGDEWKKERPVAIEGDVVYLVYWNDSKQISLFFNGAECVPAADLQIEECLA